MRMIVLSIEEDDTDEEQGNLFDILDNFFLGDSRCRPGDTRFNDQYQ
jgi:hypothetical protein